MIRLAILSDLHVEKGPWRLPPVHADLFVLAGDIGWGPEGVHWIADNVRDLPAVYVAGNREYWHHPPGVDPVAALRSAAAKLPNLHFLQDAAATFTIRGQSLRVLGATLWTDYALEGDAAGVMAKAEKAMPDYRNGRGSDGNRLTAAEVLRWNRDSVAFLERELARPWEGRTVVLTHHAPTAASLKRRRPDHVPTIASVTSLEPLIEAHNPQVWVHGHTHTSCEYRLGATRIVSNQRGEPENEDYAPLIVAL
ncbi:MAG: metallophosphoesterase [Magnetospirillum sp.]|nr:metallophosphoesterase [Magnetospirillum sp.]